MGKVIHAFEWWWEHIRKLFIIGTFHTHGYITLGPGKQQIDIVTDFPDPTEVFLKTEESDAVPTCVGDLNWTAAVLQEHGFTLYADIKSNSCLITYLIKFDIHPPEGPK